MRAAAILGPGCSAKDLRRFQRDDQIEWLRGLPDASDQVDIILLFGGDGTIHRYLSQLVQLATPVLVVPVGSGNDFARALGLSSVRDSVALWRRFCAERGNIRVIDLGTIASSPTEAGGAPALHYFCSVAGLGLGSEVTRRANRLPSWVRGHGGYAAALFPTLLRFAPFRMKITTQKASGHWETVSDQPTMLAAFANTPIYGGGMKIAPQAKMDDGQLDVCVIGGIDPFKLARLFPTVYFGRHLKIREVQYFQAARMRVETEYPLDVYADGEFVCQTPVGFGVQREALKVLVP
ncbi:MAG: diacylglycerol kinase family protein [Candidatus Sulfotelmatobacter sp.]|jgi:YegS/Rv2252/BmrU family lipid kinase